MDNGPAEGVHNRVQNVRMQIVPGVYSAMQSETNTLYGLPEFLTLTRKVVILKSLRYGYLVRIPVPGTLGAIIASHKKRTRNRVPV